MITATHMQFDRNLFQPHVMEENEPGQSESIAKPFGMAGCLDAPAHMAAGSQYRYECAYGSWSMPSSARREH